ncbi:hypothetical protein ERUR111494_09225 [Erysipelothrix urinaevulpis]
MTVTSFGNGAVTYRFLFSAKSGVPLYADSTSYLSPISAKFPSPRSM